VTYFYWKTTAAEERIRNPNYLGSGLQIPNSEIICQCPDLQTQDSDNGREADALRRKARADARAKSILYMLGPKKGHFSRQILADACANGGGDAPRKRAQEKLEESIFSSFVIQQKILLVNSTMKKSRL
jgi:hypothetical protein